MLSLRNLATLSVKKHNGNFFYISFSALLWVSVYPHVLVWQHCPILTTSLACNTDLTLPSKITESIRLNQIIICYYHEESFRREIYIIHGHHVYFKNGVTDLQLFFYRSRAPCILNVELDMIWRKDITCLRKHLCYGKDGWELSQILFQN